MPRTPDWRQVRYVLCPGMVTSRYDGQGHYVSALQLARLYGVDMRLCVIFRPPSCLPLDRYLMELKRQYREIIVLKPRYNGDYTLPT